MNSSFSGKMVFLWKLKLIYPNTPQHYNNSPISRRGQRLCILCESLQRRENKVITILYDRFFIYRTFEENLKIVWKMIYLISQITLILLTQIYYNMNFITFHHKISLALWDQSSRTATGGLLFCSIQELHISEYVCKNCLKELGILLECRETFLEKFLAASNSSKSYWSFTIF